MKIYLRKLIGALLIMAMLASLCGGALASSKKAVVSDSSARFYKNADSDSPYIKVDKGETVKVYATNGKWCKVKYDGKTGYIKKSDLSAKSSSGSSSHSSSGKSWKSKVVYMRWFNHGKDVLKKGHYGYIYDIKTGKKFKVWRQGGTNHADVEPATKKDARILKSLGSSWDARPVILKVGSTYVAASINTIAHGAQVRDHNGFNGQICLHLLGSKTHGGQEVRSDHQSAIREAYHWAH